MKKGYMKLWFYLPLAAVLVFLGSNQLWSKKHDIHTVISSDGKGYYSYLPAIFIYQDLNFGFYDAIDNTYYPQHQQEYRNKIEGKMVNKYYIGTAILMLPFFLMGHYFSIILGTYPADGYSAYYQIFIHLGTIFYGLWGIYFLEKIFNFYGISRPTQWITLILTLFGTHFFYYIVYEPSYSHVYSFFLVNAFIWLVLQVKEEFRASRFVWICVIFGMILLVRPINVLVLGTLPFFIGNKAQLYALAQKALSNLPTICVGMAVLVAICFLQLILYKVQTGSFIIYGYNQEVFYFDQPHMRQVLVSYRKGLFLYTPIVFIGFLSVFYGGYKGYISRFSFFSWLVFFFIFVYIISCWGSWWYGGGFSHRVFVEYLVIFMLPLALLLQNIPSKLRLKPAFLSFLFLLLLVNQLQMYQYRLFFIHWDSMNKAMYWDYFLRIDKVLAGEKPKDVHSYPQD